MFRSSSFRRNKSESLKRDSLLGDKGSPSLLALSIENTQGHDKPPQNSSNGEESSIGQEEEDTEDIEEETTNGSSDNPQEIEMEQILADSPPKRVPPLFKTPSKKVIISSPSFEETGDSSLMYLHNDLIRGLGPSFKELVVNRHFWNNFFMSVVHTDRKYLGWNEKTSELYDRLG